MNIASAISQIGLEGFSISGTVEKVYDRKSGKGQHGTWSFQSIVLKDESGKGIVTFSEREEINKSIEGQSIIITPVKASDVKVTKEIKGDKIYIKIAVGKGAQVSWGKVAPQAEKEEKSIDTIAAREARIESIKALRLQTFSDAIKMVMEETAKLGLKKEDMERLPVEERVIVITAMIEAAQKLGDTNFIALTRI